MAVKKQKRAIKSTPGESAPEKLTEPAAEEVQSVETLQPTVKVNPSVEPQGPAQQCPEANQPVKPSDELAQLRAQNEQILTTLAPISDRLGSIEEQLARSDASSSAVDQEAILNNLKQHISGLFDIKGSVDYVELSSVNERLRTEVEDLQLQLTAQYEKYAALRLEMEEERESATRLLQAARQREKALEQNVYQLNIREEELEELAVLNEELDAKMISQSDEFAKRTQLYEEEIFALKTAEADYQSQIAELEAKLNAG